MEHLKCLRKITPQEENEARALKRRNMLENLEETTMTHPDALNCRSKMNIPWTVAQYGRDKLWAGER